MTRAERRERAAPGTATAVRATDGATDGAFDRAFALVAHRLCRQLVDEMLLASRALSMDYESLVLWSELAHRNVAHLLPPGSLPSTALDEHGRLRCTRRALRPVRIHDLAELTGIPRETVRRKLIVLEQAGHAERAALGWIARPDGLEPLLRSSARETLRRMRAALHDVDVALADAGRAVATERGREGR